MGFGKRIFHPEIFQGRKKNHSYFEGWYFKQVSYDRKTAIAIIPGLSMGYEDQHAFIQIIVSLDDIVKTFYFRFPYSDFSYTDSPFSISIGENVFSGSGLAIHLMNTETVIDGALEFFELTPITHSLFTPNIMGFFAYFPFMECYHGIISMDHKVQGRLSVNKKTYLFQNGKGYIEKDWGRSFPKEYIWIQCNTFLDSTVSLVVSIAQIPFLKTSFKGFLCNLTVGGKEYRFASYNFAKIEKEEESGKDIHLLFKKRNLFLAVDAHITQEAILISPKSGKMNQTIKEGLSGSVSFTLSKKGKILFQGSGTNAGIEIVNQEKEK